MTFVCNSKRPWIETKNFLNQFYNNFVVSTITFYDTREM